MFPRFFNGSSSPVDLHRNHADRDDDDRHHGREDNRHHGRDDDRHHGREDNRHHGRDDDRHHGRDDDRHHGRDDDRHHHHDRDDDCDNGQHGNDGGDADGESGSGFPQIAPNTAGITFHLDWTGDGTADQYEWVPRQDLDVTGPPSFEDYYRTLLEDLRAENPDVDVSKVAIKATIYGPNAEESYYYFTGNEALDDDTSDDRHDDDRDEDDRHDDDRDDRHDDDRGDRGHDHTRGRDDRDDDRNHDRDDDRDHDRDDNCDDDRDDDDRDDDHGREAHDINWDDDAEYYCAIVQAVGPVCEDATPPEDHEDDDSANWDC